MRWLCILWLSGCGAFYDADGYYEPITIAVERGAIEVDRIELYTSVQLSSSRGGPITPELANAGLPSPNAELWRNHQSEGFAEDPSERIVWDLGDYEYAYEKIYLAVGFRGGEAVTAGHQLARSMLDRREFTISLTPVDVEVWSSYTCVRYNGSGYYAYLVKVGCE